MKKKLVLLFIAALCALSPIPARKSYGADRLKYGLILISTPFYRQSIDVFDLTSNIYFYLPSTYFIIVDAEADERGLIKCTYDGMNGYVSAEDIGIVEYLPKYVVPKDLTLTISTEFSGLLLRQQPANTSEILGTIPMGSAGLRYYNYIPGQNINNLGDKWYYVKYNDGTTDIFGYVYGAYVTLDKPITNNIIEALPEPSEQQQPAKPEDKSTEILLIVLLCLPALLIIYILFKGPRGSKYSPAANRPKYLDE